MFSASVMTAPAAGLECCGRLVGPWPHPGVVELERFLSWRVSRFAHLADGERTDDVMGCAIRLRCGLTVTCP